MGSVLDTLANYNPTGFALRNQAQQLQNDQTQAQTGMTQAATQGQQLQNQQVALQLRDQQILSDAFRQFGADPAKLDQTIRQNGISPSGYYNFRNGQLEYQTKLTGLGSAQLATEAAANKQVGAIYETLAGLKGPDRAAAIPEAVQRMQAIDPTHPVDPNRLMDDQYLQTKLGFTNYQDEILGQNLKKAQTAEAAGKGVEAQANAAKTATEQQQIQRQIALYDTLKQHPEGLSAYVSGSIDPQKYPDEYKRAMNEAAMQPDLKGINEVVSKHAQNIVEQERMEAVQRANVPNEIKVQTARMAQEHALSQGDTARAKYYESLTEMNQSLSAADTIQKVLDLSKSGNPIAGEQLKAMVPEFTNAVQDIKRMAASQGDNRLASTADKLKSEAASLFEGKPLSDSVQSAISPYVQTIRSGAVVKHNGNVASISKAYPSSSKFQPEPVPQNASSPGQIVVKAGDGSLHPFNSEQEAQTFEKLVKQAGGATSRQ